MPSVIVSDMNTPDEPFVGTCSHVNESPEIDTCAEKRLTWFRNNYERGVRVKVALLNDKPVGFLYVIPIEVCPWGPLGEHLMVIPCMFVVNDAQKNGAGRALLAAAEDEARRQKSKGLCVTCYYGDSWFMPAEFFEKHGFTPAQRKDPTAILWKKFDPSAEPPRLLKRQHDFHPHDSKVVVDLFFNDFCLTCGIESQRVREVAAEFGDAVVLNEHDADDRPSFCGCQTARGIFINGKEIGWGYDAPREGIREAISKALDK